MKYVVRLWVDLEINNVPKEKALEIARKIPISVDITNYTEDISVYDIQVSGQIWDRENV